MMWERPCEREVETRNAAVRAGRVAVEADVLRHAADCSVCEETLAVASWMQTLASTPVAEGALPDATYLWWKGELLRRWDAQQRASAPIEIGERLQVGAGLAAAAVLLGWLWQDVPDLVASSASLTVATPFAVVMILSTAVFAAAAVAVVREIVRT